MENDEIVISNDSEMGSIEAQERAAINSMIATAKKYPRNLKRSMDNATAIVSLNKKVAETCSYTLPRGGKTIHGPSVHLARILAQTYGNLRVDSRVKEITATQIVSEAVALDLETNYGVKVEVRRSIIGKEGRFSDDMITVTGNACNAIAYRNAVLSVIPKSIIDTVYEAAQNAIVGDLSDEQKLIMKRREIIDRFINEHGAKEEEVLKLCGKNAVAGVKKDDLIFLIGILQAISDGDTTVDEVFGRNQSVQKTADKLKDLAEKGYETVKKKAEEKKNEQKPTTPNHPAGENTTQRGPGRPPKQEGTIFGGNV